LTIAVGAERVADLLVREVRVERAGVVAVGVLELVAESHVGFAFSAASSDL
jgi:hypothetical protein